MRARQGSRAIGSGALRHICRYKDMKRSFELGLLTRVACFAACTLLLSPLATRAQVLPPAPQQQPPQQSQPEPNTPPAQPQATPPQQSTPEKKTGVFESFGRWFDDSAAGMRKNFDATWRGTGEAAKGTADVAGQMTKGAFDAAKGTADAFGKFGASRVVTGRQRCTLAPNGAPDCKVAAVTLCKANGYKDGDSVDYETAESCPTAAYLNGRRPATGECPIEHTVTRAMCQ